MTSIPRSSSIANKMARGDVLHVYVTGNFATPRHIDFVCGSGSFDVVWFDLEHFDIPTQELAVLNLVARAHPVSTVARIKATDYQVVMRTLEVGVDGLMCSMVADADEARRIVSWAKFNNPTPAAGETIGNRGWNGGNIDSRYGGFPAADYMRQQNTQTVLLCQIEHPAALAEARAIAAVPGVDALFFGPGDYSASIGLAGQISHPDVMQAMAGVAEAAAKAGKWWGTVAPGREMYLQARALGARFLCPGGDVKVMKLGLQELVRSFQDVPVVAGDALAATRPTYS